MTDLLDQENLATNAVEFTVSEISTALKRTVEDAFGHVRVRGEISGYRGAHGSGHAYFSLKDDKSRIEAVIWRGVMGKLQFQPEEGMEVIVTGKLTTYPGSSKYQIVIESLKPAGAGALMALLEERKKRLSQEGLFDEANKQLLPFMPKVIGVVTSPTGAVIRDIIHRISDRFPLHILVWPVRVQGETSGAEVAAAINGFNLFQNISPLLKPDVIIVARGGGSLEDLWGFNDEIVVRAVANSFIPVVSAVGHETDWTLIDYASDKRAPTPTGAAEMAVPVKADLEAKIASLAARLNNSLSRHLDLRRQRLVSALRALPNADQLLAMPRRHFDETASRLMRALSVNSDTKRQSFQAVSRSLSPRLVEALTQKGHDKNLYLSQRLSRSFNNTVERRQNQLNTILRNFTPNILMGLVDKSSERTQLYSTRLQQAYIRNTEKYRHNLDTMLRILKTVSYQSILERGFALVLDDEKKPIKRMAQVSKNKDMTLQFIDGTIKVTAKPHDENHRKQEQKTVLKSMMLKKNDQGTLF